MERKVVLGIMLTLLLTSMLTLAFSIQPLNADRPQDDGGALREDSKYASKVSITYYFPEPKIEDSRALMHDSSSKGPNNYVSVTMDGLPQCEKKGLPVLPFKTAKILLPFGTRFEQVRAITGKKMPLLGSYLVEYGREAVRANTVESPDAPVTNLPNEMVYGSSEPFPGRLYSNVSVQGKMGYEILLVNLYPVEYVPETGELFYYESIRLEVEIASENGGEISAFKGYLQRCEIVKDIVDNPEVIETYPTSEQTPPYQYVIITNEELNSTPGPCNFQALRDDKISRGISATIVTVEWIYANYDGTRPAGGEDNQTKIRNFIIDAYNDWGTMYVLLGGDGDGGDIGGESGDKIIPHRGFSASDGEDIDDDIPADMYFGCLDGTFDYDADLIYGEPNDGPDGGEVDLFAEVYVGRACVDSQAEVQNFVNKTLSYQTAATTADAHLGKVWMVGEDMDWPGAAKWGGDFKDEIKEGSNAYGYTTVGFENSPYATGFGVSTLYDRDYPGNDWPKSEIVSVINDNAHLINHLGHANVVSVMNMTNSDVDTLLTNNELYFIGYSWGCYCGAFDNRWPSGATSYYDCISEHLTTEAHGAVAFIANSRYGLAWPYTTDGPSQHYDREFWDAVLGEDIFNIGIANQDSKEDNAGRVSNEYDRYCYYEINLFGDPELMIVLPLANEHELTVVLDAPVYPEPGDSSLLNATVYNRGSNNETDVELFLIINGTTVESDTIPELVTGTSSTIDYLWTPTIEGVYNLTAYAPPVPDESITANNVKSAIVHAYVTPDILIVDDNDGENGWKYKTSLPEFELTLTNAGYDYMVWNESSMGNPPLDFLTKFKLVIWTCGDYYNWAVDATDMMTLECYLAQGGNILLEGEDIGLNHAGGNFMVNVAHAEYKVDDTSPDDGLTVTDPNHPVTQGLPTSFDWSLTPAWPDGVSPTNGGAEVIQYTGTSWTAVTVYEGASDGSVVYYAFPLYCLKQSEGEALAINSVKWLLSQEPAYLVVRGLNNIIYYRIYNSSSVSWESWNALPGSTCDTPAAAILDNQLHIVVRGMDEHSLWHGYYNLTSEEFFGWTMLEGSSPSPPVLTSNGSMLCLVVHGMNDLIYYRCYGGDSWGDWQLLPNGATIDSPAAALLGDDLHVVVRGTDGFTMWHKIILPESGVVQEWSWIPGASASPPILAASQSLGELYMLVRSADDGIYHCEYVGASWGAWTNLQGLTPTSPSATISGDELHVVVCGSDGVTLWHGIVDLESDVFGGWNWISGSTPSAPTLTS